MNVVDKLDAKLSSGETQAFASPAFDLSGRTTTFEFTQTPAAGYHRSDLKKTTIYLVAVDSTYGSAVFDALRSGEDPDPDSSDDPKVAASNAVLFELSMDDGETVAKTKMKVESGNPPFDLVGKYRLFVRTDHGVTVAAVKETR